MLFINEIISTILQIVIFTAIPFFVYLIVNRRAKGFFDYIGLRKPETRTMIYAALCADAFVMPALLLVFLSPSILEAATAPNTVISKLRANGLSGTTFILLSLKALIQTSFTEEILFRGFVAKWLINWLGYTPGNLLQALLFGAVHLLIFAGQEFSFALAIGKVLYPALGGWIMGYLNERVGNGSILPSWLMHGLTNLIAYSALLFA
jgi:membrane protease YdiL (CAAX protease family)